MFKFAQLSNEAKATRRH